jgi:nicotinic acid mononucleotide adenylyltransferase
MKDAEKIVVMGGSFNPPTIAHYKLMKDAMQVVKADLGYFVPVSDAYLKRKMRYNKISECIIAKGPYRYASVHVC